MQRHAHGISSSANGRSQKIDKPKVQELSGCVKTETPTTQSFRQQRGWPRVFDARPRQIKQRQPTIFQILQVLPECGAQCKLSRRHQTCHGARSRHRKRNFFTQVCRLPNGATSPSVSLSLRSGRERRKKPSRGFAIVHGTTHGLGESQSSPHCSMPQGTSFSWPLQRRTAQRTDLQQGRSSKVCTVIFSNMPKQPWLLAACHANGTIPSGLGHIVDDVHIRRLPSGGGASRSTARRPSG